MKTNPFRTERVRSDLNIRREYREGSIEEEHCKISSSQWMMVEPWKGKVRFYANRHLACGENRNVSIPTCLTSCRRKIDIVLPLVCRGKRAAFLNAYDRLVSRVEGRKSRGCDSNIGGNIVSFSFFFIASSNFVVDDFNVESVHNKMVGIVLFRWRTPFTAPPPPTAIWQYVCAAKTWTLCWTWRFINRITSLHSLRWSTTRSFRTSLTTWWKILSSTGTSRNIC